MKSFRGTLFVVLASSLGISMSACSAVPAAVSTPSATSTAAATAAPTIAPGNSTHTVTVNGVQRNYLLHVPPGLDASQEVPAVLVFHEYGMTPSAMETMTGFDAVADKNGFLVVYPQGTDFAWNTGICCGTALEKNVDDPAFVREILKDLGTVAKLDAKRIYATGSSNGGVLTYQLACRMSDTFAAIAPVAAQLVEAPCEPGQPVAVVHVHGTADAYIDIGSAQLSFHKWAHLDGCTGSAQSEQISAQLQHDTYASCTAGTAVELYTVNGGGHAWPDNSLLPTSETWADVLWSFFAAHPKS